MTTYGERVQAAVRGARGTARGVGAYHAGTDVMQDAALQMLKHPELMASSDEALVKYASKCMLNIRRRVGQRHKVCQAHMVRMAHVVGAYTAAAVRSPLDKLIRTEERLLLNAAWRVLDDEEYVAVRERIVGGAGFADIGRLMGRGRRFVRDSIDRAIAKAQAAVAQDAVMWQDDVRNWEPEIVASEYTSTPRPRAKRRND